MAHDCDCHAYGIYRGIVMYNDDPENLMRVRLQVPQIFGEAVTDWAWPCVGIGSTTIPSVNTPVWVMFVGGDVNIPAWIGTWKVA